MDPINRLNRLLEILRQQVSNSSQRSETQRALDSPARSRTASAKPSIADLRRQVQERIQAVRPDTPEGKRQAKRLFLESVLAWEFGDALLLDKQCPHMLERIQEVIESDPETDSQFTSLIVEMTRS